MIIIVCEFVVVIRLCVWCVSRVCSRPLGYHVQAPVSVWARYRLWQSRRRVSVWARLVWTSLQWRYTLASIAGTQVIHPLLLVVCHCVLVDALVHQVLYSLQNVPLVAMETSVYSSVAVTIVLHATPLPASARALQAGLASHVTSVSGSKSCESCALLKYHFVSVRCVMCAACAPGLYGAGCKLHCDCHNSAECNATTGDCLCAAGWRGHNCDMSEWTHCIVCLYKYSVNVCCLRAVVFLVSKHSIS